ncbi:MAG: elongation factor P [Candidatus Cloacimonetes bacterium]|nr:elongation factor P [Candidatus Cloacimonadota bacterium]
MKEAQEFRVGNIYKKGDDLFLITKAEYNKGARSASSMKFKIKNLDTGSISEIVTRADDKMDDVILDRKKMQFLYANGDVYTFMDQETYDQIELTADYLGDNIYYLIDEMVIDVLFHGSKPISIELPTVVEMRIAYTEPAVQGNTSGRVMKSAKLETGLEIQVPIFCTDDELIRIDTRTGTYMERVR